MIIFLYGQDSYRISQKLKEIVFGYRTKNPSGFNLVHFDLSDGKIEDFFEAIKSSSFIPEKKLIIAKGVFSIKNQSEPILKFLKTQNKISEENIILVITHFDDSLKNKLFEHLTKKPNQFQNFKPLKDYEIKDWAKRFLNSFDIELTGEALNFLISNCGRDLWRLDSEIRKLADFSAQGGSPEGGKIKVVSKSQVEELTIPDREHNIFELTDALLQKNKIKALKALHKAIDNGEKPTELLGLLAWQARNLLRFKMGAKPASLKLHPFVLGKLQESEKTFSMEELNAFLSKIIDLDLAFKTTDINTKTALSLLISEI